MNMRRCLDIVGVILMGDAVVHWLMRKEHTELWQEKDAPNSVYNRALRYMADHRLESRLISMAEFALGATISWVAEATVAE